jgi:hypothetical protein
MAGLHLDGPGAHPLGHEALKVWIDGAVFRGNSVVAGLGSPCRVRRLAGEQNFVERLLHGIEHLCLFLRQIAGKVTQKSFFGEAPFIAVEHDAGTRRRCRICLGQGCVILTRIRRTRGHIDER